MITAEYLDKLDAAARSIRGIDAAFGGIQVSFHNKLYHNLTSHQVIGVGDFLQLPPVRYPHERLAFEASCWNQLFPTLVRLSTVQRQADAGMSSVCAILAQF